MAWLMCYSDVILWHMGMPIIYYLFFLYNLKRIVSLLRKRTADCYYLLRPLLFFFRYFRPPFFFPYLVVFMQITTNICTYVKLSTRFMRIFQEDFHLFINLIVYNKIFTIIFIWVYYSFTCVNSLCKYELLHNWDHFYCRIYHGIPIKKLYSTFRRNSSNLIILIEKYSYEKE